jgi:hypothetical protein
MEPLAIQFTPAIPCNTIGCSREATVGLVELIPFDHPRNQYQTPYYLLTAKCEECVKQTEQMYSRSTLAMSLASDVLMELGEHHAPLSLAEPLETALMHFVASPTEENCKALHIAVQNAMEWLAQRPD